MKRILSIAFVFVLIISGYVAATAAGSPEIGKTAPNFTLTDSHGKTHSLSDFKGKYVVLEWTNFDCPFVKKHYNSKHMQKLQKEFTAKGVVWLAICSSAPGKEGYYSNDEINEKLKAEGAAETAYLIDSEGTVGRLYGAKTTPHMFIINPNGSLVYQGAIDNIKSTNIEDINKAENYVSKALMESMSGKPVTNSTSVPYGCGVKYQ